MKRKPGGNRTKSASLNFPRKLYFEETEYRFSYLMNLTMQHCGVKLFKASKTKNKKKKERKLEDR